MRASCAAKPPGHRRVAVERQPVERVAVQVEHPQAIRRHGLFAREPHGVLLRQPLKRHEQTHRASFLVISRAVEQKRRKFAQHESGPIDPDHRSKDGVRENVVQANAHKTKTVAKRVAPFAGVPRAIVPM